MYPLIDTAQPVTDPSAVALWVGKYADVLRRARSAIDRHNSDALMDVSLDGMWTHDQLPNETAIIGAQTMLAGLWAEIGVSLSWSIAIHPYGWPTDDIANITNFHNLFYISNYQAEQLLAHGIENCQNAPQYWMTATEEGWPYYFIDDKALAICSAHSIVTSMTNVLGQTHDSFQQGSPDDPYGLIPWASGLELTNASLYVTYQAYVSTSLSYWTVRNDHYCCTNNQLGCSSTTTQAVIGIIDGLIENNQLLVGWACAQGLPNAIAIQLYANNVTKLGSPVLASQPSEAAVASSSWCNSIGDNYRFAINITEYMAEYSGQTLSVLGISPIQSVADNWLLGSGSNTMP
jgi:hypothetical protein